ncbi:hypothetical protein ACJIZ3_006460 [Penstemon smallii]|uniref:Uncharacterized protein n=1 Tax=Penstemon smallii TaxID=265156 RepID=A0ABD3S827_9LAMI
MTCLFGLWESEIYVWMYASIQFALMVLFAHIFYNLVRSNRSI